MGLNITYFLLRHDLSGTSITQSPAFLGDLNKSVDSLSLNQEASWMCGAHDLALLPSIVE